MLSVSCSREPAQTLNGIKIAIMADVHFENVYATFSEGNFTGIENPVNGKYATIRTMDSQLHSTRLFNENYFAFLAALDDAVSRDAKFILLPGDLSDDGQPLNVDGLKQVLETYSEKHNITFLAVNGNHDASRPFRRDAGKTDFLGEGGRPQPVMSRNGLYNPKSADELPVSVSPDICTMGYNEMIETLGSYGFLPKKEYLYWETPFSDYDVDNYSYDKALDASVLEERRYSDPQYDLSLPDVSYLVEPLNGIWFLAIDANVYVPKESAVTDPDNPDNYSGSGGGYNLVMDSKKYLIDWVKRVSERAEKRNKMLIVFSHYPMADFYDDAAENIDKVSENGKMGTSRLPEEEVARVFADAGIKIHFGGHLHINDTGIRKTDRGNTLVNVQVPSLSAYIPAYKLLTVNDTLLNIETIVMDSVPRFNELFALYKKEYDYLQKAGVANIWKEDILQSKNYREFTNWHLKELVRLRFLPTDWPENLKEILTKSSGKDLLLMALRNNYHPVVQDAGEEEIREASILVQQKGLEIQDFGKWNGFDLIVDFYRLNSADRLAIEDIGEHRIQQYNLIFSIINGQKNKKPVTVNSLDAQMQAFAKSFQLLLNGAPSANFMVDMKNGGIVN
jgi:3',5'-cyclic AMP phosphodiesterase CpdA